MVTESGAAYYLSSPKEQRGCKQLVARHFVSGHLPDLEWHHKVLIIRFLYLSFFKFLHLVREEVRV